MSRVGKVILGVMYVPLLMSHFILIRQESEGDSLDIFYPGAGLFRGYCRLLCRERDGQEKTAPRGESGKDR